MEMNHVLIVEDDKEIREGIEIYLKSQGYQLLEKNDSPRFGESDLTAQDGVHLVLEDVNYRSNSQLGLLEEAATHKKT